MGDILADHKLHYEDMPRKQYNKKINTRKGGKDSKMSKEQKVTEVKSSKKYAKTRGEHYKDIVIAVLITSIVAFGLGVKFQSNRNAEMQRAVESAKTTQTVEEAKK